MAVAGLVKTLGHGGLRKPSPEPVPLNSKQDALEPLSSLAPELSNYDLLFD